MRSEAAPSQPPPEAPRSLADRIVEAMPVAILAAVPTYLRTRSAQGDTELAFSAFALAALLLVVPSFVLIATLRRASEGWRSVAAGAPIARGALALAVAIATLVFWEKLGEVLARVTHHRGLGGVAFAAGAAVVALGAAVAARKALAWVEAQGTTVATFAGVALFFVPVAILLALPPVLAPPGDALGLFVVDVLAMLLAGGGWVEHLAPPIWPSRARYLVAGGAFLLAVGAVPALRATSDFPLADVAFAFRFLPLR